MLLYAGQDHFHLLSEPCELPYKENFYKANLPEDANDIWLDWDFLLYSVIQNGKKSWFLRILKWDEKPVSVEVFPQTIPVEEKCDSKAVVCGHCIFILLKSGRNSKLFKVELLALLETSQKAVRDLKNSSNLTWTVVDIGRLRDVEGSYIVDISSNGKEVFAIDSCGGVYVVPKLLVKIEGHNFIAIRSGHKFNVLLTDTGAVYSWGHGNHGELGHRVSRIEETVPRRIDFFDDLPSVVTHIACGGWHTLALTSDGDVYSWGWNESGQLGHGTEKSAVIMADPYPVDIGSADNPIVDIACGSRHSAAITRKGDLLCWGNNKFGQIGPPPIQYPSTDTPQIVGRFPEVKNLFCGRWVTIVKTD